MAEYDIFRDQLAIKYPSFGHALWVPSPRNPDRPVQIGDVGFIRRGKFHRLFNSLLPADDPSHELGVPEYHEPLVPNVLDHIDRGGLSSNNYCSPGVSVEADPGYHSSGPDDFRRVSFQYQRTRGAAVLSLPVTALREDTLAQGDFGQWMVQHIDSWFAFARKLGLGIEQMEEIILVTGCDRTRSWTNIAFLGGQVDAQVSFGVNVEGPDTSINFQLSPELVRGAVIGQGPEGTNLPENQCVFIRGFRVARSFWKLPRRLKAAAGPSPDSGGYDGDPDIEVISIPATTKYRDPLHLLLDCIAEEASDCEMVLIHDDDLAMINGLGHNTPLESLEPDVIMDLFRRSDMEIHKVIRFCAKDLIPTDSDSKSDMSLVKVAALPMTSQNWRRSLIRGDTSKRDTSLQVDHGDSKSKLSALQELFLSGGKIIPLASAPSKEQVKIGIERGADRTLEPDKGDESFIRFRNRTFKDLELDKLAKEQTSPSSGGDSDSKKLLPDASSGTLGMRWKASQTAPTTIQQPPLLQPIRNILYVPPPPPLPKPPPASIPISPTQSNNSPTSLTPDSQPSDQGGSDSEAGTPWQKPVIEEDILAERPKSASRGPPLTLNIDEQFGVSPAWVSQMPPSLQWGGCTPPTRQLVRGQSKSEGTFQDSSWASRPNTEEVLDRLEAFFPDHDLDKPMVEASSSGKSPTATVSPPAPLPYKGKSADKRSSHKKSIRVIAEEHNSRQEMTSRMEPGTPAPRPIFKWVRGELIGKGSFGHVYLALNATTGEMIAVKQVEIPRMASDKNDTRQVTVAEALKLESETLKDLNHPNIVQYLGFEETPNLLSMFLEYVPGDSVGSCLRKYGRFEETITKYFTEQTLSGLEYLHSKGILHRDLKADNILVDKSGICKISDFGFSKPTDDINEQNVLTSMQGSVFWMAPEVVNTGKRGYNVKVDIWGVGCVVLEMWAGERPWRQEEALAVIVKLYSSKQAPPIPSGVTLSPLADDFRNKCFAIDPDERPSAAELREHRYLNRPPGWVFNDFSGSQEVTRDDSDDN